MSTPAVTRRARRRRARGFTLLEVMAVMLIIAILAAIALPGFVERVRDRRANEKAQEIAMFYRTARSRALGRGAAQMVRFDTSQIPQGQVVLYEAVQALAANGQAQPVSVTGCGPMPVQTCIGTTWIPGQPGIREVAHFPTSAVPLYRYAWATFNLPGTQGAAVPVADICFTPLGRAYVRSGANSPWVDMTALGQVAGSGAPYITVQRYESDTATTTPLGIARTVVIPPNGEARLFL